MATSTAPDLDPGRFRAERPPVLLLGGTNLVRALGLAGIPAIVASCDPNEDAFSSRHCRGKVVLPSYREPEAMVDALAAVGDRFHAALGRRIPLMYGNDDALDLIARHRARLEKTFLLLLNEPEIADALIEKDRFEALGLARGLPVPRPIEWSELAAHEGAVLAKPRAKRDWHDSPLHAQVFADGGKALIFANGAAASAHPMVERYRDQLCFQEYVRGDDRSLWSFHGFSDSGGRLLNWFVGRKIRTAPPLTGESAYIEMAHDDRIAATGQWVAEKLGLKGPFKMDFKVDAVSGECRILEINARYNLWHYLGACNGVNLMQVAYEHLVRGSRPEQPAYRTDYRWLFLDLDLIAYRELSRRGELGFAGWIASLLFARKVYNVFACRDPGPFIAFWKARLARKGRRARALALGWMRQWRSTAS